MIYSPELCLFSSNKYLDSYIHHFFFCSVELDIFEIFVWCFYFFVLSTEEDLTNMDVTEYSRVIMYFENKNVLLSLGTDLQVCTSKNSTCCTKKMEERYQIAAKQDIQEVLQASSSALKFLISHNAAAFQGKPFCCTFHSFFKNNFLNFITFDWLVIKVIYEF